MTSKHLFFKVMREDLRHKIWMIALSVLGNFLAFPVAWLVLQNNQGAGAGKYEWAEVLRFFGEWAAVAGGFIALAGALIVGLFGFRYVFHRNMVDTYHSFPVKRGVLFGACWLNGFLIWLVPFLAGYILTFIMALIFALGHAGESFMLWELVRTAGTTLLILTVAFLLVYHLVLTAVMLSGNVLNTLVSMVVMGAVVLCIYMLGACFLDVYMETFYGPTVRPQWACYLSPLASAVYLLALRVEGMNYHNLGMQELWQPFWINAVITAALGVIAGILYRKRASESAEQGIRNKTLSTVMKMAVSVTAGMCGWLFFYLCTNPNDSVVWTVFGALLAGIVAFGVADMIFSMDFKAFFSHKLQMAAAAAVSLLVCFSLYGDWYGFDSYLPDREDVAKVAIWDPGCSNRGINYYGAYYGDESGETWYMADIEDLDAAYGFLEVMTEREKGAETNDGTTLPADTDGQHYSKRIRTKVTLDSGRSYYRVYNVLDSDWELMAPLYKDRGYLEANYLIGEELADRFGSISLERSDKFSQYMEVSDEVIKILTEAYNKDLLEHPDTLIRHQGRLLANVSLEATVSSDTGTVYDNRIYQLELPVHDTMENTVEAMKELGYGEWVQEKDAEEIEEIDLYVHLGAGESYSAKEVMEAACRRFGLSTETAASFSENTDTDALLTEPAQETFDAKTYSYDTKVGEVGDMTVKITDKAEIRELLALMSYTEEPVDHVFDKEFVTVYVTESNGETYNCYLRDGELPEKYVARFGEQYEELTRQ